MFSQSLISCCGSLSAFRIIVIPMFPFPSHLSIPPLPPSPYRFQHSHTIIRPSLLLSLMSATEVRVWVFCPRATRPVTSALPATLHRSVGRVIRIAASPSRQDTFPRSRTSTCSIMWCLARVLSQITKQDLVRLRGELSQILI